MQNSPSVVKALERYIHPERLDSDNAYNCTKYVIYDQMI